MADEVEKVTKNVIASGGVLVMLYFDIHANTKEAVQELGTGFVNILIQKPGVVYAMGEIDEPMGGSDGKNWSSSVAVKMLAIDFTTLAAICMTHSPFNIEILRPDEITLPLSQAHDLLGTISATCAEYKKHILTKIATPGELAQLQENLKRRAEMGKRILGRTGDGK